MTPVPDISVVVPSHDRPLRLRWLLNALEEQTLPRERWEIVIAHDSSGPETDELLQTHPLAQAGVLRHHRLPPGTGGPGRHRNIAWRAARGRWILFTDDDCRPPADWVANALAAAEAHPDAVIQGMTTKDPVEQALLHAPLFHSQYVIPPTPWAEACNILYPRDLLERVGGYIEDAWTGEDTDLAIRCKAAGADYLAVPEVHTYHSIVDVSLLQALRTTQRWIDLPLVLKRHPSFREALPMWIFWKRTHVWLPWFFLGVKLSKKSFLFTALCVPWLVHAGRVHGTNPRGRYRTVVELPLRMILDLGEMWALLRGSVKHRTFII